MFSDDITKKIAAAAAQIKTEPPKNEVNTKSVEGAVVSIMTNEELKGNQHKIDANKNGKIDAHDFKLLRGKKDMKKEEVGLDEAKTQSKDEKDKVVGAVTKAMRQSYANVMQGRNERSAARMNAKIKNNMKEEIEQLDEVGDTPAGRKTLGSYVSKAIADKSKDRTKGLRKATSRMYKDNYYGKKTNEEVEQLDEIGDTPAGQKRLLKTFKRQNRFAGSSQAGKASVATHRKSGTGAALDYGDKVMDQASKRMSDTTKNKRSVFMSKVKNPQPHKSDRPGFLSRAASAVKKVFTREEVELMQQMQEFAAAAIASVRVNEGVAGVQPNYKPRVAGVQASDKPRVGGIQASDKPKVAGVEGKKSPRRDIFGHDSERQQSGYRGPGQSVLQTAADKVSGAAKGLHGMVKKAGSTIKKVFSREEVEVIFNDFTLDEIHMFMMSEEFEMLNVESKEQIDSYLQDRTSFEESQLDEAFPTVADAKKRMAAKESPFEKKKISTGTVYSRKYKSESDDADDMPKKKAKTMKEMLDIYKQHGAESLVENLMIEEPSQDEYKKEVEVAQAKSEGKIRNDKQIAKAATQGVKMEGVENIGEASTYKLGRAAAETKDFPIHHNGEHVGKLEFHTSAGKLHHRVSSVAGVPHEKFIGHPDREKMTNAHVAKHEAEARKHFAKKLKEDVELEMYDADEINGVQVDNIEERSLTSAEMNKREEIVKSMKKGIQGFKDRYGERAKEVMYATATARAKKD